MYQRAFWQDHVTDQHGEVIQQGTLLDQSHFNNMEQGIDDVTLARKIAQFQARQLGYNQETELQVINLAMNSGLAWPWNNKETTVALRQMRESLDYSVEVGVLAHSGGFVGNIRVEGRARNGFKLVHDGSATDVQVAVRITGGMTDTKLDESNI